LLFAGLAVVAYAPPTAAQECDPQYGCEERSNTGAFAVLGNEQTRPDPTCTTTGGATAGSRMGADVTNVPDGTEVRLLLDGVEVGRKQATPTRSDGLTTVAFSFVVPALERSARVEAVGAGLSAACPPIGVAGVAVTASPRPGSGSGSLPRTGMLVAAWALAGVILIAAGRVVVSGARHRQLRGRTAR
jgi:hypothetical protein